MSLSWAIRIKLYCIPDGPRLIRSEPSFERYKFSQLPFDFKCEMSDDLADMIGFELRSTGGWILFLKCDSCDELRWMFCDELFAAVKWLLSAWSSFESSLVVSFWVCSIAAATAATAAACICELLLRKLNGLPVDSLRKGGGVETFWCPLCSKN